MYVSPFVPQYKPLIAENEDNIEMEVTLSKLNCILEEYIQRTFKTVKKAMSNLNLTENDIDHVILVGGSSRLKLVHQKLGELFGERKLKQSVNPDECVAKGACLYLMNKSMIHERIAYALSTSIINKRVLCVIPRLAELPATYSVNTYTVEDGQRSAGSSIYQTQQEKNNDIIPIRFELGETGSL